MTRTLLPHPGRWRAGVLALLSTAALALTVAGCKETAPDTVKAPAAPKVPAPPVVVAEGGPYVLRYFSPTTGNLLVAKKVADVPDGARAQVLVVPDDPKLQGPWLFVADVSGQGGDGFPVSVVDRFAMEREREAEQAKVTAATEAKADGEIVLYKTAWCGYCKKAARYLELKGVTFTTMDLERDAGARQDMIRRARSAGFPESRLQGVPILYIKGKILSGFSRDAIDAALKG